MVEVARDAEGYLIDPLDWDEAVAARIAHEEGIELDDEVWCVLRFMRAFHEERQIAPDVRDVVGELMEQYGYEKKRAKTRLFELFPYGYVKQACKISGMRKPRAWSTG